MTTAQSAEGDKKNDRKKRKRGTVRETQMVADGKGSLHTHIHTHTHMHTNT